MSAQQEIDHLFLTAVEKNSTKDFHTYLDLGADIHTRNDAALHFAAYWGNEEICHWLLKLGANVHGDGGEELPLMSALNRNHPNVVRLLLDYGADHLYSNKFLFTLAKDRGFTEIYEMLMFENSRRAQKAAGLEPYCPPSRPDAAIAQETAKPQP